MAETGSEHVWDIMQRAKIAMFITWDGEKQRARPMAAIPKRDQHAIYFLTDHNSAKDHQIERFPVVTLAFSDPGKNNYATVSGEAVVSNDREKIRELFSPFAKAWWDSPEDPNIRVIKVNPEDAEYWDSPAGPISMIKMLAAAATNHRPDMGDHEKVRM